MVGFLYVKIKIIIEIFFDLEMFLFDLKNTLKRPLLLKKILIVTRNSIANNLNDLLSQLYLETYFPYKYDQVNKKK